MPVEASDSVPSIAEFRGLRVAAGLSDFGEEATRISLSNSQHGVWLRDTGTLIAMGRLIGDGGAFAQVTDIAVHPNWQRQGLGHRIMTELMAWADANLPTGAYISLIADAGAERLYERHGFTHRTGMARTVP
ncbi:MAG: GNAT family N-acetyltransferase [Pseudomonadota bacterium]